MSNRSSPGCQGVTKILTTSLADAIKKSKSHSTNSVVHSKFAVRDGASEESCGRQLVIH
jgi:hypothetical protein